MPALCVAAAKAVGGKEEGTHVARPTGGVAGRRAHAGNQKDVRQAVKPVRTPVAILGSLGVCIYVPASRHWLISHSAIHLT